MSLNISDKTVSLIVKSYSDSLVLVTRPLQDMPQFLSKKKMQFEDRHVDYSGFGIKIILFE